MSFFVLLAAILLMPFSVAAAATLEVDREACKLLTVHHPLPNVAYNAGVDVYGNAVAPADLNPGPVLGDTLNIPVTVDIGEQFGIPMGSVEGTRATIAMITVDGSKVYLDGQPLTPEQEDNLAVLCLEANAE